MLVMNRHRWQVLAAMGGHYPSLTWNNPACNQHRYFRLIWNIYMWKVVTMVTKITKCHRCKLPKNSGKICRFWNQEIQELKENSENQNTTKVHSPGSFLDQLGWKQELWNQFAQLQSKTTQPKLNGLLRL